MASTPGSGSNQGVNQAFLDRLLPWLRRLQAYTRLKVDGLENVPTKGPALVVGNHTGWLGLDYALSAFSIYEAHERLVRGMAHAAWFKAKATADFARKLGIVPVSKDAIVEGLTAGELVMMFPEGERGAFRPGTDYTLEPFARGFVRAALRTRSPIIPVCILGGEESNPVGRQIESYEDLLQVQGGLPVPKNLLPRPVKWRIRFLPALDLSDLPPDAENDSERVHEIAGGVQATIQAELRKMKLERGHPYL